MVLGGEQTLFDRQLAHRDFEDFEVADFLDHRRGGMEVVAMVVAMVVVMIVAVVVIGRLGHLSFVPVPASGQSPAGSSQRSGSSVCSVSFSNGYPSQRSFCLKRTM